MRTHRTPRGIALVVLCLATLVAASPARAAGRPNVIVLITDDQGYGDLSCPGNPVLRTPNLDRLHGQSVRLTDFHAAPMCTPTRGQLLTGLDALRNGAMNVSSGRALLRRGIPTAADLLAAGGGYRCGHFGKWHLGDNHPYRPQDRGFHKALWFPSSHIGSAPDHWNNHYFNDVYQHDGKPQRFDGYTTDVLFDQAIGWMRAQAQEGKPFFCYLATAAAHAPLFVPQKYRDLYKGQPHNLASFFGQIANIDENVGKLDAFLAGAGLRDDTIVVFLTDNGGTAGVPTFNAGMRGTKVTLWEGGHRVPCFVRWPGGRLAASGTDVGGLTQAQDLLPTLLDLCGVPPPAGARFDGVSLAAPLRGHAHVPPDRMLVVHYSRMNAPEPTKDGAAVLWKRWRLLENKQLYDLATDRKQERNVIADHPDVAARMRAHLDAWWAGVAPGLNELSAVVIGSDAEDPVLLSPADWQDAFLDQGKQVREGLRRNGAWNVEVERDGTYAFELRRWPREADAALAAALPAVRHADGQFPPGKALPIAKAQLVVGEAAVRSAAVRPADKAVVFEVPLRRGRTRLQTWFLDEDGTELCGAYYVYVRRAAGDPAKGAADPDQ